MSDVDLSRARAMARENQQRLAAGSAACDYRVGLAATFTSEALGPFLVAGLVEAGRAPDVRHAPFNQVVQACLDPASAFGPDALDAIVILWRAEDLWARDADGLRAPPEEAFRRAQASQDQLAEAIRTLRQSFAGTLVVSDSPFPHTAWSDLRDLGGAGERRRYAALARRWSESIGDLPGVRVLDLDALQAFHGAQRAKDPRKWYLYRQPYRDEFLALVGERVASLLRLSFSAPGKCAVVDCDGTLWGGVVGEDGWDGVALGEDFPGSAYRDFQKLLLHWRRRGVLLAILSRNNEADVWEVFDRRPEMLLRREDIAASAIGWESKPDLLRRIVDALGLGAESMVFFDDSASEIGEMQARRPEVTCVQLPDDPARLLEVVTRRHPFEALDVTAEDARRQQMMREEERRGGLRARLTPEEFLASLNLKVDVREAAPEDLPRFAQLVNKTNQFNLTAIRRTTDEIRALSEAPAHHLYVLRAEDRFGDYGLCGAAILREADADREIDTFLLSCRVLGRQVETAFLAAIAQDARAGGRAGLLARFVPTARNAPASEFLPRHGFSPGEGGRWRLELDRPPAVPPHIEMRR